MRAPWLLWVIVLAGCAARVSGGVSTAKDSQRDAPPSEEPLAADDVPPADEAADASATDEPAPETMAEAERTPSPLPPDGVLGTIDRSALLLIIDAGLGRFFQRVRVAPELNAGRFVGFRIEAIDPTWAAAPFEPGDVVRRVNGQAIERPEQAMTAFERLRGAEELVVDFTRAGEDATVRFRIH